MSSRNINKSNISFENKGNSVFNNCLTMRYNSPKKGGIHLNLGNEYKSPRHGIPNTFPKYRFSLALKKSVYDIIGEKSKNTPSCVDHSTKLPWNGKLIKLSKSKKETAIELEAARRKQFPAPTQYNNNKLPSKIKLCKFSKSLRLPFVSDFEFLGKTIPSPNQYSIKVKINSTRFKKER